MPTAENAKLQYEAGQNSVPSAALTNSGDNTTFASGAALWSGRSGYTPVVRPNGLLTGGAVTATATNDTVAVAAATLNLNGALAAFVADTVAIVRPASTKANINSIIIDASGALDVETGTDSATTAFSETRGVAGGPPLIPVDAVEVAQVRTAVSAAGVISTAEIKSVIGLHREFAASPLYTVAAGSGEVTFNDALPLTHVGGIPKAVWASYATPIFGDVALASDFVPPETSNSVSSTQVYGATIGSSSSTLNQGKFTAYLEDGVTDALILLKNENLWFKFFPDRYKSPTIRCQGKLGVGRTFPVADSIQAACTISATEAAIGVA